MFGVLVRHAVHEGFGMPNHGARADAVLGQLIASVAVIRQRVQRRVIERLGPVNLGLHLLEREFCGFHIVDQVREVQAGEHNHRRLVLFCQVKGPCRRVERVLQILHRQDDAWELAVARANHGGQVRLLVAGRHAGAGAAALHDQHDDWHLVDPGQREMLDHQVKAAAR